MAITYDCDYCGTAIHRGSDWVSFQVDDRSAGARARQLDRMGLEDLEHRLQSDLHFHLQCVRSLIGMLDDRVQWAKGEETPGGLQWELVEQDRRGPRLRRQAVLEPRYENRILDLCRERGIDRDQLAEQLGTSRGAVGRWLKSYVTEIGRPIGITAKWLKRLQMFFDLDSKDELFTSKPTGDAPAEEFVRAY